jgi:hypothetical protein
MSLAQTLDGKLLLSLVPSSRPPLLPSSHSLSTVAGNIESNKRTKKRSSKPIRRRITISISHYMVPCMSIKCVIKTTAEQRRRRAEGKTTTKQPEQ